MRHMVLLVRHVSRTTWSSAGCDRATTGGRLRSRSGYPITYPITYPFPLTNHYGRGALWAAESGPYHQSRAMSTSATYDGEGTAWH